MFIETDRALLENQIIRGLFLSEQFFLKVYDANPVAEDLFLYDVTRNIYLAILNHFVEKGYPSAPDVFNQLILDNATAELKDYFLRVIVQSEPTFNFSTITGLLEDTVERQTRKKIDEIEKKKIIGLDYAETIREEVDQILIQKYHCYKKDNRTNEEKVSEVLANIQRTRSGDSSDYIKTGFTRLDSAIIGIPKSHMTTIASRPGMGKTSFMLQLKRNMVSQGIKPLIISLEMTGDQLLIKDLSAYSLIDSRNIESGNINDEDSSKITAAAKNIYKDNYFIEDDATWTIEKIKATIRRYIIKQRIDIVFIDYLTLIKAPNRRDRFDLAIGEITNSLREFAKETKLPIVILSQLNRDCEKRIDKKPILSDLRESGSIEQDSKTVLFLFRPCYYGIVSERLIDYSTEENEPLKNDEYSEIIVAKCRNGKTGIVSLRYRPEVHLFDDLLRKDTERNWNPAKSNSSHITPIMKHYQETDNEDPF